MSMDVEEVIAAYVPAGPPVAWPEVAGEVRAWVRAAQPGHRRRALQLLHAAAHLALWCQERDVPVRSEVALRDSTVEAFCAAAERDGRHSTTTRATIRSRLRCVAAAHAVPGNRPPAPTLSRKRIRAPYSEVELAGYRALADAQSKPLRRRRLLALLAAGAGAGCGPVDLRHLHGTDITRAADGAVLVEIRGPHPRRVVADTAWAEVLLDAAGATGGGLLVGGVKADRRSVTTGLLARIEGGGDLPPLDPGRLRATWLARHLAAGTRLDVLMAAAGLSTPTTIVDLVAFLPPPPDPVLRQLLRPLTPASAAGELP